MNITKNKPINLLLALACLQLTPSCAPLLKAGAVDIEVPQHFEHQSKQPGNTAEMQWASFFDDPQLEALIDAALANNQEIKIAMQDIHMANNEVYARTGEYAPFLSFKSTADVEKVGRYTRNGAVEANTEMRPGEAFPEPLPNFMVGVFASWELDVWKRLRNARDVAVFERMATVEGRRFLITRLVAEIANAYYELMALDNKLKNLEESIAIQTKVLRIIRLLKQAARSNELAVKRFEAEVQKNQSQVYVLRQEVAETENKLNYLIGPVALRPFSPKPWPVVCPPNCSTIGQTLSRLKMSWPPPI